MTNRLFPRRCDPDRLTEELIGAFSGTASFEFQDIFTIVSANLSEREVGHWEEDVLRLRVYEKLQRLVEIGAVSKEGKVYSGDAEMLATLTEQLAARHCRELLVAVQTTLPNN